MSRFAARSRQRLLNWPLTALSHPSACCAVIAAWRCSWKWGGNSSNNGWKGSASALVIQWDIPDQRRYRTEWWNGATKPCLTTDLSSFSIEDDAWSLRQKCGSIDMVTGQNVVSSIVCWTVLNVLAYMVPVYMIPYTFLVLTSETDTDN